MPINQMVMGTDYHSYCNLGIGNYFHHEGRQLQPNYNYLADMDVPHTHIINHPFDISFNYEHAFLGASSLKVEKVSIKLLKVLIPASINLEQEYSLVITVHGTQGISPVFRYISKNLEDRVFTAKLVKTEPVNDWKRFTFRLVTELKSLKGPIRSIIELTSIKAPYYIGEIKLMKSSKETHLIKCRLSNSQDMIPAGKYYLNLAI